MKQFQKRLRNYICFSVRDTMVTIGIFALAFILCFVLQQFSENDFHVPLIFVLVVMIISRVTSGYFYGLISTVAGVIAVNYVFTYPYFDLDFTLTGYPLTFTTMLVVSLITCTMNTIIKTQERYIRESEKEKLRADLLRGISHDIRTPLTGIVGATNTLLEHEELPAEQKRELLQDIHHDSEWLIHMIENVLSITRIGNSSYELDKSSEIVEEIAGEAVRKFRKQWPEITVRVQVPDEILFVPMDGILIEQVIQNLLHNSAIHGEYCTKIALTITHEGGDAVFTIQDNGCGFTWDSSAANSLQPIPAVSQDKSDRQKNMGIGLTVCRSIIRAHQGTLTFANASEGGAIVIFRLPIS